MDPGKQITKFIDFEPFTERSLETGKSLENYAALLRQTARADEAERMEARAKAIRAKSE